MDEHVDDYPSWDEIYRDCPEMVDDDERFLEEVAAMLEKQSPVWPLLSTEQLATCRSLEEKHSGETVHILLMHDEWCSKLTGGQCCCKPEKRIVTGKELDQYITRQ